MKCPNCSGNINEITRICDFCNTTFTLEELERIEQDVKGTYELKKGIAYKSDLLKNAETHFKLGNISEANRFFEQVSYEFPDDYRGWIGIVRCHTCNYTDFKKTDNQINQCKTFVDKALIVAKESEKTAIFENWQNYVNKWNVEQQIKRDRLIAEENARLEAEIANERARREVEIANERARREVEIANERARREAEIANERARREAEKLAKIRKRIATLVILIMEVAFIGAVFIFKFLGIINRVDLEEYIVCNVIFLASVVISSVLAYIVKLRVMPYISAALGTVATALLLTSLEGKEIVFGFVIFGFIEFCVFFMAIRATKASNK